MRVHTIVLSAFAVCAALAFPAMAATFRADLDPAAYDAASRLLVKGEGQVNASLDGAILTIDGKFSGLTSNATKARLGQAIVTGAPAKTFFADLVIANSPAGTIKGSVTLTPAQLATLNAKALFIQIDAVKTTAAGSLWGWFLPVATKGAR